MARINTGRFTHRHSGELVVFLIGMRINQPWRPDLWLPAFRAMPRMLAELLGEPGSGLLGYRMSIGAGGPVIVQYWDSVEKLYAYASAPESEHRPAWTAFNQVARKAPGAVGIWHETFQVSRAESMYVSMPAQGLAKATGLVPVGPRGDRAKDRLAGSQ
ncbi:hypothetical protein BJG92_02070 [Arthrobacter sp. SO5]|uniref:DUF4188 domain-containing protein n=1 Tax=Arthrobacter sp. SO5 TaxID=1897055 RepID=UPI001E2F6D8D|nr:DUF4188 domain-containing protein [Arthrobacter sp. SO5]MCB5274534.1 hypothetical protein [Arthrobacter sp. SO5]